MKGSVEVLWKNEPESDLDPCSSSCGFAAEAGKKKRVEVLEQVEWRSHEAAVTNQA